MTEKTALDIQIAGSHYKNKRIQPVEYIVANNLTFLEGCVVKRITRWRDKPADRKFEDLEKIKHEIDLIIELETKYPNAKLLEKSSTTALPVSSDPLIRSFQSFSRLLQRKRGTTSFFTPIRKNK